MYKLPLSGTYVCTYFFTPCLYDPKSTTFVRSSFNTFAKVNLLTKKSKLNDGLKYAYSSSSASAATAATYVVK